MEPYQKSRKFWPFSPGTPLGLRDNTRILRRTQMATLPTIFSLPLEMDAHWAHRLKEHQAYLIEEVVSLLDADLEDTFHNKVDNLLDDNDPINQGIEFELD